MDEVTLTLNSPITEEQRDAITDVDFDHTNEITFHTKHGKQVVFVKRKKGRWIPVSERLPEEGGRYLVTVDFFGQTFTLINTWEERKWIPSNDDVVAWMPLPEPYKGGTE